MIEGLLYYVRTALWPGLGLLGESYLLFSMGTLKPVLEQLYPGCYQGGCRVRSLTYSVIVGVILGMLVLGYFAGTVGRRRGSIITASLMTAGAIGMMIVSVLAKSLTPNLLFDIFAGSLFVLGIGVGGEYPLSAASASEKAMEADTQNTRGRHIQLVFSMQGVGIFLHCVLLWALFALGLDVSEQSLLTVWRILYIVGVFLLLTVLISRIQLLQESNVWARDVEHAIDEKTMHAITDRESPSSTHLPTIQLTSTVSSLSTPSVAIQDHHHHYHHVPEHAIDGSLLWEHYGMRLVGSSLSWFLWDVAFYGNKLFQSSFLLALTGEDTTLSEFAGAATLNAGVALVGYFCAAYILEVFGRKQVQLFGFLSTGLLFVLVGFFFHSLHPTVLVVLYLGSTYAGQVGPNATTFLIPAEIFPTELRTAFHGIAAASGKLGAFTASVAFFHLKEVDMFLYSGYASFAAAAVTYWCIPETKGLDLHENDKFWRAAQSGKSYKGPARSPEYLSAFERQKIAKKHHEASGNFVVGDHYDAIYS